MDIINKLFDLIGKIPATFWGIVIGSFFSLGGVVLANRANDRRLREQLNHDREMRNRDRELSLRKDVYLSAAEAVSAGIRALGRFADLEIPDNKLTEAYMDKSSAITKVDVIANEQTVEVLMNLVGELNAAYLSLSSKRLPLSAQNIKIIFLQQQINSFSQERDRMLELMRQFNLDGSNDKRRWEIMNENFNFEQKRIDEMSKQKAMLFDSLIVKQLQFAKECIEEINRLTRLSVPVIASVRAELEIPIDEQVYAEMIERSIKKQKPNIEAFMENIQSLSTTLQGSATDAQKTTSR